MKGCRESLRNICLVVFLSPSHENIRYYFILLLLFITHLHSTMCPLVASYSALRLGLPYVTIFHIFTNYSHFSILIHLLETRPYGSQLHTSHFITLTVTFSSHWYHLYPQ
jgi:hypothetical protein